MQRLQTSVNGVDSEPPAVRLATACFLGSFGHWLCVIRREGLTLCDGQAEGRVRVDPQSQHVSKLLAVDEGVVVVPPPSSLTG